MPNPFCPICGTPISGKAYCSLQHRDQAKYQRRRARERGSLEIASEPASGITFWPDPLDLGTLTMFISNLAPGSEIWFADALEFSSWQVPEGFSWEVLSDGKGRLKRL